MTENFPAPRHFCAVLGSPIAHSLSPIVHEAAYRELGLDWEYHRFEVKEQELAQFLDTHSGSWRGFSLTMPLKKVARTLLSSEDDIVALTGSVNTIVCSDTGGAEVRRGYNTDVSGIAMTLTEHRAEYSQKVVVIGAGATAASVLLALSKRGVTDIVLCVRNPLAAEDLLRFAKKCGLTVTLCNFSEVSHHLESAMLVITTLPGGTEFPGPFPERVLRDALLFDVSYHPWPSSTAQLWGTAGGRSVSGLTMLLYQALVQLRLFVHGDSERVLLNEVGVLNAMRESLQLPPVER